MVRRACMCAFTALSLLALPVVAIASDAEVGWHWRAVDTELVPEGLFWNDFLVDGQDRWKSGGITQSYLIPERVFDRDPWTPWLPDRASGLEISARAVIVTPDNTSAEGYNANDRPYAQYFGLGLYLRSDRRPRPVGGDHGNSAGHLTLGVEDRAGVELGWIGDPLILFDAQDLVHDMFGLGRTRIDDTNRVDGSLLANVEGRRTWRFHRGGRPDLQAAPYVQLSAGLRENSVRVGGNLLAGRGLAGRTWNMDPATGAMIPGARLPRQGVDWAAYVGGDIGLVASDALLGGGPAVTGPSIDPERLVPRARAGLVVGVGPVAVNYGLAWIGPEFEGQDGGQLIGSVAIKLPF